LNIFKRRAIRAALAATSRHPRELIRFMLSRSFSALTFPTAYGAVVIPTNSGSIIESFLSGSYFGASTIDAFLGCGPRASRLLNIGANVGSSARMIIAAGTYHRIDCFEPDPGNFAFLQMNAALAPQISVHNAALGAMSGELSLNLNPSSIGRHSFKTDFGTGSIAVPVRRIDDVVGANEAFDIFMDVEGWEIEVLRGASAKLRNCGLCALEWNGQLHSPAERQAMAEILLAAGFDTAADLKDPEAACAIADLPHYDTQRDLVFTRSGEKRLDPLIAV